VAAWQLVAQKTDANAAQELTIQADRVVDPFQVCSSQGMAQIPLSRIFLGAVFAAPPLQRRQQDSAALRRAGVLRHTANMVTVRCVGACEDPRCSGRSTVWEDGWS
jgi:hypothetical protein